MFSPVVKRVSSSSDFPNPRPRDSLREWLEESLHKLPDLHIRGMFGGAGIYAQDTMFGILANGRMYLKTNDSTRQAFVDLGMGPFRARKGQVLKTYYEVPPSVLDDDDELLRWARRALEVAESAPQRSRTRVTVSPAEVVEGRAPATQQLVGRRRKRSAKKTRKPHSGTR